MLLFCEIFKTSIIIAPKIKQIKGGGRFNGFFVKVRQTEGRVLLEGVGLVRLLSDYHTMCFGKIFFAERSG